MEGLFTVIVLCLISALEAVWVLSRSIIPAELVMIFLILVFVLIAVLNMNRRIFWKLVFLGFLINLLNLGYLFLEFGTGIILFVCLMLACVGMGIAIMNMYSSQRSFSKMRKVVPLKAREMIPEPPEYKAETEVKPAVEKKFSPGKYVVSKAGKQYHVPRCIWAKKINEKNKMWFESQEEAKKKGYTRHWCVKK